MKRLMCVTVVLAAVVICVAGCQSMYYGAMEKIGFQKREIFADRVKSARKSQAKAKEQFKDALGKFGEVVDYSGGKLEKKYNRLSSSLEKCEKRAKDVREEINDVASVAKALFREWQTELKKYKDAGLRKASEDQLYETREKYDRMIASMRRAEKSMNPVLRTFQDQVLFLKHNLNAQAIASIQMEAENVESEVTRLLKDMEDSIREADIFIREMGVN